jgi:hypothetical protein
MTPDTANDAAILDLFRRFVDAEIPYGSAAHALDRAEYAAAMEMGTLTPPWEFDDVIERRPGEEGRPFRCHETRRWPDTGVIERRVTSYDAPTMDTAEAMSRDALAPDIAAYDAAIENIYEKHEIPQLTLTRDARLKPAFTLRRAIAEAPADSWLALAIKLAVLMWRGGYDLREPQPLDDNRPIDDYEEAALLSAYKQAVKACGFDPLQTGRKAVTTAWTDRDKAGGA